MFALGLSLLGLLGGINFSLLRYEVVFSLVFIMPESDIPLV